MLYFTKRLLLLFLLPFFCLFSFGQEKKQYSGPLQLGSLEGKASYQYILKDSDTILDGPFKLENANLGALIEKSDASIAITGAYKNGRAHGPWFFQFGQYESNSESNLVGFEYRVLISGRQEQGSGSFVGGKPDGQWKYSIDIIKDSEIEKNLFKSNINFKGGIPQQSFQVENSNTVLVGRTLRNGIAHDSWESYDSKAIENTESWVFNEGLLEKIVLVVDGVTNELPVFTSKVNFRTVELNEAYLKLIELTLPEEQAIVIQKGIGALLHENIGYYQKMDSLLNHLGEASLKIGIQVKVPEYPLDSKATEHLASFQEDYLQAQKIADELLKNSHLNIVKRSDENAYYHFQLAEKINMDYLTPLKKVNDLVELGLIANISSKSLFERLWQGQMPKDEISVTIDSLDNTKVFRLDNSKDYNFEKPSAQTLHQLAEFSHLSLQQIKSALADKLTNEARLQDLNELEEELIKMNDSLVQKIDSSKSKIPHNFQSALMHITELSDKSLATYAALDNAEEKLSFGNRLKSCLNELHHLSEIIIVLPETSRAIDKLYKDAVWNPFMATVMEEDVKKQLTAAYKNQLIPYFLASVESLQCEGTVNLADQIEQVHHYMETLRDAHTKKLERKLKRERDPEKIISLLEQEVTEKDAKHEK